MVFVRKIAISGANGFIARNLRRLASENDIQVVCIARKNFRARKNETKVITADYADKDIQPSLKGCLAFIHLVGIGRQDKFGYVATNLDLTKRLVRLCKKSKVRKFVFNSGLGASSRSTTDYFITKYRAEQEIVNSKLDHTIFRPSYILGRDDYLTKSLKKQIKSGALIIPGSGKFLMQPIHVDDACRIILQAAISKKYSKAIFDLVGSKIITYEKLLSQIPCRRKKTSLEEAYHSAICDPGYVFGVDDLNILVGSFTGNHTRLAKNFKIQFTEYGRALKASGLS